MTVYIDIVFLENLIINYIIIYAVAIITKEKVKQIRLIAGSLIGAIYVVIYYISKLEWYVNVISKIVLSIVMIYITFNPKTLKKLMKQTILFYLVSFVFAGSSLGIIYMVDYKSITIQNGVLVGDYTIKTIILGVIIAFIIIVMGFKIVKNKISRKDLYCKIYITLNNKEIETIAMTDTGNLLKEPITNIPVIVVEHTLLYEVIPKEILNNLENILGGDLKNIPLSTQEEFLPKLKVIPFSSLGKQHGMLLGIKADKIEIEQEETRKTIEKGIIGIYNKSLTKRGEYRALIGLEIL